MRHVLRRIMPNPSSVCQWTLEKTWDLKGATNKRLTIGLDATRKFHVYATITGNSGLGVHLSLPELKYLLSEECRKRVMGHFKVPQSPGTCHIVGNCAFHCVKITEDSPALKISRSDGHQFHTTLGIISASRMYELMPMLLHFVAILEREAIKVEEWLLCAIANVKEDASKMGIGTIRSETNAQQAVYKSGLSLVSECAPSSNRKTEFQLDMFFRHNVLMSRMAYDFLELFMY